jgi:two-component system OmpR family response regulator
MRVLVVEDEPKMADLLRRGLEEGGFVVDATDRGEDALWMASSSPYDAILLDVMLPGIDGYETCRRLREEEVWAPVLMLTALGEIENRVSGLDGGADDYLVKPFAFPELMARVRAVARRGTAERRTILEVGDLTMDLGSRTVWRGGVDIPLSATEFCLLEAFMRRPGDVLTRLDLLEAGWNMDYDNKSNVIAVYVGYLRNKIDRPFGREDLETVRRAGYRLRAG